MESAAHAATGRHIALCTRFPAAGDVVKKWSLELLMTTLDRIHTVMADVLDQHHFAQETLDIAVLEERLTVVATADRLPELCEVAREVDRLVCADVAFPSGVRAHLGQAIAPCDVLPEKIGRDAAQRWAQGASVYLADHIARVAQPRQIIIDEDAFFGAHVDIDGVKLTAAEEVDLQGVRGPRRLRSIIEDGRPQFVRNLSRLRPQLKDFEDRVAAIKATWQSVQEPQSDLVASDDATQDRSAVLARSLAGLKATYNGPLGEMLKWFAKSGELSRQSDLAAHLRAFVASYKDLLALLTELVAMPADERQNAPIAPIIELMSRGEEQLGSLHRLADSMIREGDGGSVLDPPNRGPLDFLADVAPNLTSR